MHEHHRNITMQPHSKMKSLLKKIFSTKNNLTFGRLVLRGIQLFVALGIFASIASMIVPNFKDDYEERMKAGIFKLGMHVEENISDQTHTTNVCMTSDFSISEQEALRQYQKNTGMLVSKDTNITFTEGCDDNLEYIYLAIK